MLRNELSLLALIQKRQDAILKPVGDSSKHLLQTLKYKNIITVINHLQYFSALCQLNIYKVGLTKPKKTQNYQLSSAYSIDLFLKLVPKSLLNLRCLYLSCFWI